MVITQAVPPACRREVLPAPTPVGAGLDLVVELGPWRPRAPVRHLVPSFSSLSPEPCAFRFELAACRAGAWTPWAATVTVGDADFAPLPTEVDGLTTDVDLWTTTEPAEAVRLRLRLRAAAPAPLLDAPWLLALSACDPAAGAGAASTARMRSEPPARAGPGARGAPGARRPAVRIEVPALSQAVEAPDIAMRICSATSVAMVLAHFGVPVGAAELAAEVYHAGLDRYGVWPAAVRAAARRGLLGYLLRFPDWDSAAWCLERGLPIVASVRYGAGELPGAPLTETAGHLVVLTGYDGDDVLVNDPAAPDVAGVPRRDRRADLARVWLGRAGVGYVFFRPGGPGR
jgi:hypothetical protein